jgi:hypothetical protein
MLLLANGAISCPRSYGQKMTAAYPKVISRIDAYAFKTILLQDIPHIMAFIGWPDFIILV